jgi:thiosulfate/3-mercaptopyruvate sulfurtransferase
MDSIYSPLISASDLIDLIEDDNVVIVDATNSLDANKLYQNNHIKGAVFVDLNTQLANIQPDISMGGRHPLPNLKDFSKTLAKLGISLDSRVIIYDNSNGANAAARFWWMLRAIGHNKVQVLDGGFKNVLIHNIPTSNNIEVRVSKQEIKLTEWKLPIAYIDEVENYSTNKNCLIVDVRDENRYNGNYEPLDLIAGHIPNAINIPFINNIDIDGLFISSIKLREIYLPLIEKYSIDNIIVHCGSGVTACHTLLAFAYAGLEMPKLYVGSWSEWSRNHKPTITNF